MKLSFSVAIVISLLPELTAFGQGSLNPPAAPTPTMKSLDQVKAGTPIGSAPYTISSPGSYFLTSNLTVSSGNAITISTNGVTLDLNGFTITSTSSTASGNGIYLSNVEDVTILNGHITGGVTYNGSSFSTGPGFQSGIIWQFPGNNPVNVHVSGVTISGITATGIELGSEYSNVVDHCTVRTAGGQGIRAGVVDTCTAYQCGSNAINSVTASNCYGVAVSSGYGVFTYTALNCWGVSASGHGIDALTAACCYGTSTSGFGLSANNAINCYGSSNSSYGLNALETNNCYGISSSNVGLYVTDNALNSHGETSSGNYGLEYPLNASNCSGKNGGSATYDTGLLAFNVINCRGDCSGPGTGLNSQTSAMNSWGVATGSGIGASCITIAIGCGGYSTGTTALGLTAYIGNSCIGENSSGIGGAAETVTYKYNMP